MEHIHPVMFCRECHITLDYDTTVHEPKASQSNCPNCGTTTHNPIIGKFTYEDAVTMRDN